MMTTALEQNISSASKKSSNLKYKNPRVPDIANTMAENIFESKFEGDWDILKDFLLLP